MLSIWAAQLESLMVDPHLFSGLKKIEPCELAKMLLPQVGLVDSSHWLELGEIPWVSWPVMLM